MKLSGDLYLKIFFSVNGIYWMSHHADVGKTMDPTLENMLVSIDFDLKSFPKKHTCDGENISPKIVIERITSPYLALILFDMDVPGEFTHWTIWNIPTKGEKFEIPEGIPNKRELKSPISAMQGKNDAGRIGYAGPCPPKGETHQYYFNVYGLDIALPLAPGSTRKQLEEAMKGRTRQYSGTAIAFYNR